jgi:site-specific DNA-cytosine methylase
VSEKAKQRLQENGFRHQVSQQVPSDMDLCIAGFSCKDFSLVNKNRKHAKVKDRRQSSEKTLAGVHDYSARHRPRYLVLENVKGVLRKTSESKESAAAEILSMFLQIGYHGVFMPLDT